MLAISVVMLASFAAIYFMTSGNLRYINQSKLEDIAANGSSLTSLEYPSGFGLGGTVTIVAPNAHYSFTISADQSGQIMEINSQCNLSQADYEKAVAAAMAGGSNATIQLGNMQWQFLVSTRDKDNHYLIAFLDVTESLRTLHSLTVTLAKIAGIALLFIFALSYFFANQAIKPLRLAWEKQAQFIADASHELKTPISIITANYDALATKKDKTIGSQMRWLNNIKIGTDRMTMLTNDLLTLARLENGGHIQKSTFDMGAAVTGVISLFENLLLKKNIWLETQIAANTIVSTDRDKIAQVITILFDNAIKYTEENGLIKLTLTKSRHYTELTLENTSQELLEKDISKVFDRFYRGDPSRSKETFGYGLGLPIAKTIIENLGGNIHADCVQNNRVSFTFSIPLT